MKKLLLAVFISLGVFVAPLSVGAASAAPKNSVQGTVTNVAGHTVMGAKVYITCNGVQKKDTADVNGNFFAQFKKTVCPDGANLLVSAVKGNKSGQVDTTIQPNADGVTTVGVQISAPVSVPEFNPLIGVSTVAAVGGGLLVMRRRQVGQN